MAAGFLGRCDIHYGRLLIISVMGITLKKSHYDLLPSEIVLGEDLVLSVEPGEQAGRGLPGSR